MFVDEVKIYVQGGSGGDGAVAFRREKFVPAGGPAGGDGGRGGSVILEVDSGLSTLMDLKHQRHYRAPRGGAGGLNNRFGRDGDDVVIRVPPGTRVLTETGELLEDLTEPGQRMVAARGGAGGKGNSHFASSVHRAPRIAERGEPGEERMIVLELNLLADVGLVGFPNAGKSTLIRSVSGARPKVADYPFTTLEPHLGVVDQYGEAFVIADIPGLIEGAHAGAGLGDTFLRHLSRTRVLVHMIDVSPQPDRDPVADYETIHHELASYAEDFLQKPMIVVANKMDVTGAEDGLKQLQNHLPDQKVWAISAAGRQGLDDLMWHIRQVLNDSPYQPFTGPDAVVPATVQPVVRGFQLVEEEHGVRVVGDVEARALRTMWGRREAERFFLEYLRRRGLVAALRRANIPDGTTVLVGEGQFVWHDGDLDLD
ncbi:MAG: GTPase ObgE [Firmicutes bacterium]|nr:GTPase ObgE [Bacillota bacterium]